MILAANFSKLSVLTSIIFLFSCVNNKEEKNYFKLVKGFAQGTTYSIKYKDVFDRDFSYSFDSILKVIDQQLSTYDSTSFISKVNNLSDTCINLKGNDLFHFCLNYSKKMASLTNGFFNPAVYPLVNYWGFYNDTIPIIDSMFIKDSILIYVDLDLNFKITKRNSEVFLCKKNKKSKLDFNAVAQGYSVDLIADFLNNKGVIHYLIEIGGELAAKGLNINGEPWKIGIEKPVDNSFAAEHTFQNIIELNNKSLATSGNYRKFKIINGQKVAHSINPKTGYPAKNSLLSVTVISDKAAEADALATAFMVMGKEETISYIKTHSKDSILCYMVYDSINKYKEWSNF